MCPHALSICLVPLAQSRRGLPIHHPCNLANSNRLNCARRRCSSPCCPAFLFCLGPVRVSLSLWSSLANCMVFFLLVDYCNPCRGGYLPDFLAPTGDHPMRRGGRARAAISARQKGPAFPLSMSRYRPLGVGAEDFVHNSCGGEQRGPLQHSLFECLPPSDPVVKSVSVDWAPSPSLHFLSSSVMNEMAILISSCPVGSPHLASLIFRFFDFP